MLKKVLSLVMAVLFVLSAAACGQSGVTEGTTTAQPEGSETAPPPEEKLFFEKDGSFMYENGKYMNESGELNDVILSCEEYPVSQRYDFTVSVNSAGARARLFFDIKLAEDGSVASAYAVQLNALNSRITVMEIDGKKETTLASVRYKFVKDTDHIISVRSGMASLSVHVGIGTVEEYPVINLSLKRMAKSKIGIGFCGGKKAAVSAPVISEDPLVGEDAGYRNPMLEDAVIPDPTVLYHDGTYYMFATGSFVCRTSTDLVNWKVARSVAPSTGLYGTKYFGGAAIYERDGIFYMTYTSHQTADSGLSVFYATADNPLGPFKQEGTMKEHILLSQNSPAGSFLFRDPVSGKDVLYFYRTDPGKGNVVYGTNIKIENGKITVTDNEPTMIATPTESWEMKKENGISLPVCERPNVIYHNGYYYVFYAGSHFKTSYSEGYVVSDQLLTGFTKPKDNNPVLDATASLTGVGCTWIVPSPDGSELFVLYHCHDEVDSFRKRRLCMDRLTFRADPEGGPDIPVIHGPTVTYQPLPK